MNNVTYCHYSVDNHFISTGRYFEPLEGAKYWYRYSDDIEHERGFGVHEIHLSCFHVLKETERTVVLKIGPRMTKRCFKDARKSFAYPTRKIALNSYLIRKRWQVRRLEQQLEDARIMLAGAALATGMMK